MILSSQKENNHESHPLLLPRINRTRCVLLYATNNVSYLFAHGLYNDHKLAYYYENLRKPHEFHVIDQEVHLPYKSGSSHIWHLENPDDASFWVIQKPNTFNFPDATRKGFVANQLRARK